MKRDNGLLAHDDTRLCPSLPGLPQAAPPLTAPEPLRVRRGTLSPLTLVPKLKAAPLATVRQETPPGEPPREEVDAWYVIEVVA